MAIMKNKPLWGDVGPYILRLVRKILYNKLGNDTFVLSRIRAEIITLGYDPNFEHFLSTMNELMLENMSYETGSGGRYFRDGIQFHIVKQRLTKKGVEIENMDELLVSLHSHGNIEWDSREKKLKLMIKNIYLDWE